LEKEKTLTKNLGLAANKLQNVLKQTQEQLSKERKKNRMLKVGLPPLPPPASTTDMLFA